MDNLVLTPDNPRERVVYARWITNRHTGKRVYPKRARFFRFRVRA